MPYRPRDEAPSWPDPAVEAARHLVVDAYHELTGPVAAVAPAGSGGPEADERRDDLPDAEAPTP